MAALLDEVMGSAAWLAGLTVVAAKVSVDFRRMIPIGSVVNIEAGIDSMHDRKVYTRGSLHGDDGTLYAEATGLFVVLRAEQFADLANAAQRTVASARSEGDRSAPCPSKPS